MCTYLNTKTDVAQNLFNDFFLTVTVKRPFHRKDFKWKKYGGTGSIFQKTEVLYAELNERAEAATRSYYVTGDSLQYIYSVVVVKFFIGTSIYIPLYFPESDIVKYFSIMICHNLVSQNGMMKLILKKISHRNLDGMFRWILVIYGRAMKKYLSRFI